MNIVYVCISFDRLLQYLEVSMKKTERGVCFIADVVYVVAPADFIYLLLLQDICCLSQNATCDHVTHSYELGVFMSVIGPIWSTLRIHLSGWNCICHLVSHEASLFRSCWRKAASLGLEMSYIRWCHQQTVGPWHVHHLEDH